MPRILHIIPSLDQSGAEKQLVLLAAGLREAGEFDVEVCALTRGGPLANQLRAKGVPCTVIGKKWKVDPAAYWRLEKHIRATQPDLVQTWLFAANSYGRMAALRAGVPHVVASERCVDRWKVWHEFAVDRWLAKRTDRVVVNSSAISEFYIEHGLPAEKFVVIANGVSRPAVSSQDRGELLQSLNLPPEARLIGAVGRLWPQKRLKDLIWAADLLKVIRDDVHLLVIGDGPDRERLLRYREQVRIKDRVHFLGHRTDVESLLPHFDLLWLASGYEGLPNVVMEAMAAGVPVVATDIPGTRELVISGETGFLVPVGDRAAFAQRANQILEDRELRARLGEAGKQRMESEFSVERMVARYAKLYRELLGNSAGTSRAHSQRALSP